MLKALNQLGITGYYPTYVAANINIQCELVLFYRDILLRENAQFRAETYTLLEEYNPNLTREVRDMMEVELALIGIVD